MKLSPDAVFYLLSRRYSDARYYAGGGGRALKLVDYPILYDVSSDMSGHTVLVPSQERPKAGPAMQGVLCVCTGSDTARTLEEEGIAHVHVRDKVTFQHLYNHMQRESVVHERMDAQLNAHVGTYAGFQPMLDALADAFGCSCTLFDQNLQRVCYAVGQDLLREGQGGVGVGMFEEEAADLFMASADYPRMRYSHKVFAIPGSHSLFMKNIFSGDDLVGSLVVPHDGSVAGARFTQFVLDYFAPFVEKMYGRIGSYTQQSSKSDSIRSAVAALIAGLPADPPTVDRLLVADGHPEGSSYALLLVDRQFSREGAEGTRYLAQRIERSWRRSYSIEVDGKLYVLAYMGADASDHARALRTDLPELLRDVMAKAGVSRLFRSMSSLGAAGFQARAALDQGQADDPTFWYYHFEDYALAWLLAHGSGNLPLDYVCHPAVTALARYDDEHGSELLRTLSVLIGCRYNATTAAKKLYVARSTLLARLEHIQKLTDIDLDDFDDRVYAALSLKLVGR